MKRFVFCCSIASIIACGPGEAGPQDVEEQAQEAVDRALAGEEPPAPASAGTACSMLEDLVPELVGVDLSAATVHPSAGGGHDVCSMSWPLAEGQSAKRYGNEVSLTIMKDTYDSPEAAVSSLESAVTTLTEGVTVEAQGREVTVKSGFGDWVEGVGDRAITKKRAVMAASNGRRFTIGVSVVDDDAENQAQAIELARAIAGRL
jgi:hypothetical protein